MIFAPGAKGWVNKYFELVSKHEIRLEIDRHGGIDKMTFTHLVFANSGLIFGLAHKLLFSNHLVSPLWTKEEKLKVLLLEGHIFIYLINNKNTPFNSELFLHQLYTFYKGHEGKDIGHFDFDEDDILGKTKIIEKILSKRVDIKKRWLENRWWVHSLSNSFVYLDVILFDDFCFKKNAHAIVDYASYAKLCLTTIVLSAQADGIVDRSEKNMLKVFLASSNLKDNDRNEIDDLINNKASFFDLPDWIKDSWLLRRFMLDLAILTVVADDEFSEIEHQFLDEFSIYLDISKDELSEYTGIVERLFVRTRNELDFLADEIAFQKVYNRFLKRWIAIVGRNKHKLITELKQSKELISLVKKASTQELSDKEKKLVKTQFKDIAKTVPSLAIFMLPGGTLLLPIILKIIPDLIPSAFVDNKLENEK